MRSVCNATCGVFVMYLGCAGMNAATVAEAALGMILMLARRVPEQRTVFAKRGLGQPLGMQLAGKTLGIVGMGAIGR